MVELLLQTLDALVNDFALDDFIISFISGLVIGGRLNKEIPRPLELEVVHGAALSSWSLVGHHRFVNGLPDSLEVEP